ncbi:MAG: DUF2610 domain-containing protein [Lewinellaceae bacterium]|nr:DUF2610 domain-containing protein [Lewinellaceae bacterium]
MELLLHELPQGCTLKQNRYRIEKKLGSGGFGITYKALYEKQISIQESYRQFSTTAKIPVAVKELFIDGKCIRNTDGATMSLQGMKINDFEHFKTRFLKEAETLAQFHDIPEIVQVIDYFEENSTAYMVMSFIEGKNLSEEVKTNGPVDEHTAVGYILQIAQGLTGVHQKGILHRDISPENIIITPDNQAVLIDFGAAREFSTDHALTQSVILKHGYAPIEQYSQKRPRGPYTDIYALAATCWFCMTGKKPVSVMDRERGDNPFYVESGSPKLNRWLEKATAYNPEDRFRSCEEVTAFWEETPGEAPTAYAAFVSEPPADEVAQTLFIAPQEDVHQAKTIFDRAESAIVQVEVPKPERSRTKSWRYAVAAILLLGGIIGGYFSYRAHVVNGILDEAWTHYKALEYREAYDLYKLAVGYNSPKAMYFLGHMYLYGRGVEKDLVKSREFIDLAMENGFNAAAFDLGWNYYRGTDVKTDTAEASRYFKIAFPALKTQAEKGDPEFQNLLGLSYNYGFGTPVDSSLSFYWYEKAAKQGHPSGMGNLAIAYRFGFGAKQDYDKAAEWYTKAADIGFMTGFQGLGEMYHFGLSFEKNDSTALEYFRKAAEQDLPEAQDWMGTMYANGFGVKKDPDEAVWWYRKAAEAGYTQSQNTLGTKYHNGEGVPVNYKEAQKWYLLAAEKDDAYAEGNLGLLYDNKKIFNDKTQAEKWFRRAAQHDGATGINMLAQYYYNSEAGLSKDDPEASVWYNKAAENNHGFAQLAIAKIYETGNKHFEQSDSLAAKWYLEAGKKGYKDAMVKLADFYKNGKGVEKDSYEANRWSQNARYGAKNFTIQCIVEGKKGTYPFSIVLLEMPAKGKGPVEEENERLKREYKAQMPVSAVESFGKLYNLARKNDVSFVELCVYAVDKARKQ